MCAYIIYPCSYYFTHSDDILKCRVAQGYCCNLFLLDYCIGCLCLHLLGKILGITRGFTPQQLLLLKQQTSLHQHQQALATPTQHVQTISAPTQAAIVQQKLSLPSGIEQLRATVASAASALPRFTGMTTNSGSTVKGLTGGRTRHVEEVLKQQSLRMATKAAITQGVGGATIVQVPSAKVQELEKLVTKSGVIGSGDKGQVKAGTQLTKPDKV